MDTHTAVASQVVDGESLIQQLDAVNGLTGRSTGVFDTSDEKVMNEAIRVLRTNGYVPFKVDMIDSDFYLVGFMPNWGIYPYRMEYWPSWVRLRFVADGITQQPLVLASRSDRGFVRYGGQYYRNMVFGAQSSDAEKILLDFQRDHPHKKHIWVPLFGDEAALF